MPGEHDDVLDDLVVCTPPREAVVPTNSPTADEIDMMHSNGPEHPRIQCRCYPRCYPLRPTPAVRVSDETPTCTEQLKSV